MDPLQVFVASASEQLETAWAVAAALTDGVGLVAYPWTEKTFTFSNTYIESLEEELDRADFGVVVLTGSDSAVLREKSVTLPRDNVIFELGLFMGRFGRKRCFFFVDGDSDTKIASDLAGVKPVTFSRTASGVSPSIEPAARALRKQMLRQPPRPKFTRRSREAQQDLWQFAARMKGHYWERMRDSEQHASDERPNEDVALSFVNVTVDETTGTPKMEGKAFTRKGAPFGDWHSVTSSVVLGDRPRVLYYWEGNHDSTPGQIYGGGGYIQFDDQELVTGEAHHYDTNLASTSMPTTTRSRHVGMYRCEGDEVEVMKRPWSDEAKRLMARKLKTLRGR